MYKAGPSRHAPPRTFTLDRNCTLGVHYGMADLQQWMQDNERTDETLAQELGVSRVQVSRLRRRICKPSPATAQKLEAITAIPAAEFIFGEVA